MTDFLQLDQNAHEFLRRAKMGQCVASVLLDQPPAGFVASAAGKTNVECRNIVVDGTLIVDPPAANEERVEMAAPQIPLHVLPERGKADSEKFAAVAKDLNLGSGRQAA